MLALAGVTSMLVSVSDETVSPVDPVTLVPASVSVALIVIGPPALIGVTSPLEPVVLLTVAMVLLEDRQVT
jgi:hypothetical protein